MMELYDSDLAVELKSHHGLSSHDLGSNGVPTPAPSVSSDSGKRRKSDTSPTSSDNQEDEVMYNGRKIPRSQRLKQMRESQKLLREQRKNKIHELEAQNQELRDEIHKLKQISRFNGSFLDANVRYHSSSFFPVNMGKPSKKYVELDCTSYFLNTPAEKIHKLYLGDGKNVLFYIFEKTINIFDQMSPLCMEAEEMLKSTIFRYTASREQREIFQEHMVNFTKAKTIPEHWEGASKYLPDGVISIFRIVDYLITYTDLLMISMEVFSSFVATFSFATYWGPAIFVIDLSKCVRAAIDPSYDSAFLSNILEDQICQLRVKPE